MFDPAAVFGVGAAAKLAAASKTKETPVASAAAANATTRLFDPSALYAVPASSSSDGLSTVKLPRAPDDADTSAKPEPPSSSETRVFASQDLAGFFAGTSAAAGSSAARTNDAKAENPKQNSPPKDRSR